jgi:hypothetical protein
MYRWVEERVQVDHPSSVDAIGAVVASSLVAALVPPVSQEPYY